MNLQICDVLCVAGLKNVHFYLDHRKQGASKQLSELSSDVQHVHLATSHHHPNQGVIVSACTLKRSKRYVAVFIAKAENSVCIFMTFKTILWLITSYYKSYIYTFSSLLGSCGCWSLSQLLLVDKLKVYCRATSTNLRFNLHFFWFF